jgi:hypothetical protein
LVKGLGTSGQIGIYSNILGAIDVIADTSTLVPEGVGTFTDFSGRLIPEAPAAQDIG